MADDGQSAFAEPMSMQEALDKANVLTEEKLSEQPAPEPEPQAEEVVQEATEETAEEVTEPEPAQSDEGPQTLDDEYNDILIQTGDDAITLKELKDGYSRQADYSRKTMQLSEQRKTLDAEHAERMQALEAREQQLNAREAELDDEPDWVKLAEEDPLAYAEQQAKWNAKKAKADAAKQKLEAQQQKTVREFSRRTAEKAVEIFPEWSDGAKFDEGADARKQAALDAGFTDAEYSQVYDFRLAALLEKAARYDALQKSDKDKSVAAEKRISAAPKVLKPGQSKGPSDPNAERRAAISKRFQKPGITTADIKGMLGR